MRTHLAANFHAAPSRFTKQSHTSGCSEVLAMNVMIAEFGEQNIAHDDRFFACGGPARQSEQCAPVAFVHDAVADQIVILAMIEYRHANHARVLDRASHHLVILNATTVVGDRHNTSLSE